MKLKDLVPWRSQSSSLPVRASDEITPFTDLQRGINRLFDDFFSDWPLGRGHWLEQRAFSPRIDVSETGKELNIRAEVPGLKQEDVNLELTNDCLIISGEKKTEEHREDGGTSYYETSYGSFQRSVPLNVEIDRDRIDAKLKDGVLTVTLPKTRAAQQETKKIAVQVE
jgi:HSP20 family protein